MWLLSALMMRMMMPKYHVTVCIQQTYEIEAPDEGEAATNFFDGNLIDTQFMELDVEVEPVNA